MTEHRVEVDRSGAVAELRFPAVFNAAADLLDTQLERGRGDHPAYVDAQETLSYAGLAERACRAGNALVELGLVPEQRVLLVLLDTCAFPATFLGAMRAGLVPVPVNTLLTVADYAGMLRDSRARAVVVSASLRATLEAALAELPRGPGHPPPPALVVSDAEGDPQSLQARMAAASPELAPYASGPDDVAFWLYSSGSTGAPKGTLHLHRSPRTTAVLYAEGVLGFGPDDVVHSAAKLFFAYGLGNALTFPLAVGATAVLQPGRPTPVAVAEVMRAHRPTIFNGVPTLFASLLADPDFAGAISDRLRLSTSAGEGLPAHLGRAWRERFGSPILDGIGSTEMLHVYLSNRPDDVKDGTTGRPVPGYALELRDEDGSPTEEAGILWVRAPSAAAGYWSNRAKTLQNFHGPWFQSGDRYRRDADGYYVYDGRADDMLKVSGIYVSPFEVESALIGHDAVLEAAVVAHANDDGLIKPKAFVVLNAGVASSADLAQELQAFVKSQLAPYKYPRWVEFVDALPKTATGKVQRFKLR